MSATPSSTPRPLRSAATLLGATILIGLAACGDDTGCSPTDQAIVVQVRDSVTGEPVVGIATGRIRSPSFYGTLEPVSDEPVTALAGAAPPGRYQVTIDAAGYQPWSESRVEVESDGSCSARPITIEARLQPL